MLQLIFQKWSKNLNKALVQNFQKRNFPKKYVEPNLVLSQIPLTDGGGGLPPKKVAQNDVKHILRSDDFLGVMGGGGVEEGGVSEKVNRQLTNCTTNLTYKQTYGHYGD